MFGDNDVRHRREVRPSHQRCKLTIVRAGTFCPSLPCRGIVPIVTSVAIELDQPLVTDPEVMRDLVEHDVSDLAA